MIDSIYVKMLDDILKIINSGEFKTSGKKNDIKPIFNLCNAVFFDHAFNVDYIFESFEKMGVIVQQDGDNYKINSEKIKEIIRWYKIFYILKDELKFRIIAQFDSLYQLQMLYKKSWIWIKSGFAHDHKVFLNVDSILWWFKTKHIHRKNIQGEIIYIDQGEEIFIKYIDKKAEREAKIKKVIYG